MEDVSTPLANQSNLQALGVEQLPEHMVSSLNIIDQLETRIRDIKQATLQDLAGNHQASVTATLNQLNHDVELAAPPSMIASNTPSSQGISPAPYHASPSISVAPPQASPYSQMAPSPYQSVQMPQVQQHHQHPPPSSYHPARSLAQINTNAMPPPQQMQISPVKTHASQQSLLPSLPVESKRPPPLDMSGIQNLQVPITFEPPPMVHSHSFPNGHQLPSQLHAPNTPVSASPSFVNALGVPHAPVISSPLAAMPVSRPPSPPRPFPLPDQAPLPIVHSETDLRLDSRADMSKRPGANRTRSTSVHRAKAFNGMVISAPALSNPPSAWHSRANSPDDEESEQSDDNGGKRYKRRRSSTSVADMSSAEISPDIKMHMDVIFHDYLNNVCSDLEFKDAKGDKVHQVLMPKKMARLDESKDYRPFKFRIQSFSNGFQEELSRRGITEETITPKKLKHYLWRQDLISRFNDEGKKAKSKGNHVWNILAKKLPDGSWVFKPYSRTIIVQPQPFATVGKVYEYEPKVWDPQAAVETIKPTFSSPHGSLPHWLRWDNTGTKLVGVADCPSNPFTVEVIADFLDSDGNQCMLETSYTLQAVAPVPPAQAVAYGQPQVAGWMIAPHQQLPPQPMPYMGQAHMGQPMPQMMYGMPGDPFMHPHGYPLPPHHHPHNPYNQ